MGELLFKNSRGGMEYLNLFFNKNGEVRGPQAIYYNVGGEVIKFPKLPNLLLNLDAMTWAGGGQTLKNCSSFSKAPVSMTHSSEALQNFGPISNQTTPSGSENFFVNPSERFWGVGNTKPDITFSNPAGFANQGNFSIFFKVQLLWTTSAWNNVFIIGEQQCRIEVGATLNDIHYYQNNGASIESVANNIETTPNTIALTFTESQVVMYLNGVNVGSVGTSSLGNISNFSLNVRRSGGRCLDIKFFQLSAWNATLTAQEILAMHKISMLGG